MLLLGSFWNGPIGSGARRKCHRRQQAILKQQSHTHHWRPTLHSLSEAKKLLHLSSLSLSLFLGQLRFSLCCACACSCARARACVRGLSLSLSLSHARLHQITPRKRLRQVKRSSFYVGAAGGGRRRPAAAGGGRWRLAAAGGGWWRLAAAAATVFLSTG